MKSYSIIRYTGKSEAVNLPFDSFMGEETVEVRMNNFSKTHVFETRVVQTSIGAIPCIVVPSVKGFIVGEVISVSVKHPDPNPKEEEIQEIATT
jgi:hypothetical protein